MDYKALANEYMEVMYHLGRRNAHKQINDSMHGEHFVLFYISEHEGNVTPSDISNKMGISSARIATALNGLEKKKFISRKIDVNDRRRILVNLTESGQEQVKNHYQMIINITTNMLKYLGETDAKEFIRIMKKLSERNPKDFI